MGFLNEIAGIGYCAGLMGGGLGIPTHPSQLAAMQQQQAAFDPFGFQRQQAFNAEYQNFHEHIMSELRDNNIKHPCESRELSFMEIARKEIQDAVQEVKQAQREV